MPPSSSMPSSSVHPSMPSSSSRSPPPPSSRSPPPPNSLAVSGGSAPAAESSPPPRASGSSPAAKGGGDKRHKIMVLFENFLKSREFNGLMGLLTVYALIGDDLRLAGYELEEDQIFFDISIFAMALFILEIVLNVTFREEYVWGFYFWLDLISTASMIPDCDILGTSDIPPIDEGPTDPEDVSRDQNDDGSSSNGGNSAATLKAGKTSRAGAKAGRVVKIVRLIRFVRIFKLLKLRQEGEKNDWIKETKMQISSVKKVARGIAESINEHAHGAGHGHGHDGEKLDKAHDGGGGGGEEVGGGGGDRRRPVDADELSRQKAYEGGAAVDAAVPDHEGDGSETLGPSAIEEKRREDLEYAKSLESLRGVKIIDDEPSKVGKKLTELTVRKVIIIILLMIMTFPIIDNPQSFLGDFDLNQYENQKILDLHFMTSRWNLSDAAEDGNRISEGFFKEEVQNFALNSRLVLPILYVKFNQWPIETTNGWIREVTKKHNLYEREKEVYQHHRVGDVKRPFLEPLLSCEQHNFTADPTPFYHCGTTILYDLAKTNSFNASLSLYKTLVIVIGLSVSVIAFSRDAEDLVIQPIERMIRLVKKLSDNPLASLYSDKKENGEGNFETNLLENTLEKISSLLQVGFGIAGAEIIQSNMSSGGELNVMIPGKKITAVFGFGIIDEFTNTCSCLEEEMCTYINTIAKIIHEDSIQFYGAPNKNIGSAFLLVWKICEGVLPGLRDLRDSSSPELDPTTKADLRSQIGFMKKGGGKQERKIDPQEMVDSAMVALIKMRIDLHIANMPDGLFERFKHNKKLVEYFEGRFSVEMGFGMHIGWAIEGAIGSNYKIDASYLSPNVNMAARLEAATHQFGTPILISGPLINEMSANAKSLCRMIDVVTVKGSQIPLELWTADISNYETNYVVNEIDENDMQQPLDWDKIRGVQTDMDTDFKRIFCEGVEAYVAGDWTKAQNDMNKAFELYPDDGPTNSLLKVMGWSNFVAPKGWKGYRELTSK